MIFPSPFFLCIFWFDKTGEKAEFKLNPIGGKAYVIRTEEVEIKPVVPKKFNMYGDY